jgi:hypothetical protein
MNTAERWSLVVLWWGTAVVSVIGWGGLSHDLVRTAGWVPEAMVSLLVAGGIAVDLLIGGWLAFRPGAQACRAGLAVVVIFTLLASVMVPGEWLHPLGPLLKNLPIAALMLRGCEWTPIRSAT